MSGDQTSGKGGEVQCVMMVIYMLDIVCLSDEKILKLALLPLANYLVLYFLSYTLTQYY